MSKAFAPSPGRTVNVDVSSSSQAVPLGLAGPGQIRVMNDGSATVWLNWGLSGVTATTAAGMPIGPGVHEVITIRNFGAATYMAAIAAGSTGKIYFTPGEGI